MKTEALVIGTLVPGSLYLWYSTWAHFQGLQKNLKVYVYPGRSIGNQEDCGNGEWKKLQNSSRFQLRLFERNCHRHVQTKLTRVRAVFGLTTSISDNAISQASSGQNPEMSIETLVCLYPQFRMKRSWCVYIPWSRTQRSWCSTFPKFIEWDISENNGIENAWNIARWGWWRACYDTVLAKTTLTDVAKEFRQQLQQEKITHVLREDVHLNGQASNVHHIVFITVDSLLQTSQKWVAYWFPQTCVRKFEMFLTEQQNATSRTSLL